MLITNMLHKPLKVAETMVNMSINSFSSYSLPSLHLIKQKSRLLKKTY